MADKIESYWTVRRGVLSRISDHLSDLRNESVLSDESRDSVEDMSFGRSGSNQNSGVANSNLAQSSNELVDMAGTCSDFELSDETQGQTNENIVGDESENDNLEHIFHSQNLSSESDGDSESDVEQEEKPFSQQLGEWATTFQIPNIALLYLLTLLRQYFSSLPKDPRTLLHTQVTYDVSDLAGGQYYHFGILSSLSQKAEPHLYLLDDGFCFSLQINIDGLPLFKSTSDQFWPILGKIQNLCDKTPFIIGLFSGQSKPSNLNDYLRKFVDEYKELNENGFDINGKHFNVQLDSVICDAPARAFVKCIKGHSGYSGCDKCTQCGVYVEKMTFPETNAPLRTDVSFNAFEDEDHHKGISPLVELNIGMVSQLPQDYMHLVCLGVVKRLLLLWKKGPLRYRLGSQDLNQISDSMLSLKDYVPCDRQFLLYTGPLVLLNVVHQNIYKNCLLLFVAMHILLNESLCNIYNAYTHDLLVAFVSHFGQIYGNDMLVYNVHGLVHLSNDAAKYGSLDIVSSFPFENFLGKLKRMVRKPSFALQQIIRRLSEQKVMNTSNKREKEYPILRKEHAVGPVPDVLANGIQYSSVETTKYSIKLNARDSCVCVNGKLVIVKNLVLKDADVFIVYCAFRKTEDFFDTPVSSHFLGIQTVYDLEVQTNIAKLTEVQSKSMYAVVEFTDGLEVDVIPCSWLTQNRKKAYWPMWKNSDKIHAAVKRCTTPGADYMCLDVRVLYESDSFDKARGKLSNAVETSNLETSDAEDALGVETAQKRKKRPNPKYNDISSTESEGENIPAPPLRRSPRKKAKSFPELPPLPVLPQLSSPLSQQTEPTEPLQPSGIRSPPCLSSLARPSAASPIPIQRSPGPDALSKPRVTATDIKVISILEEIKGQVRFNTKLLQNILTKVDVPVPVGGNEAELDLGIEFPLKDMDDLNALEEQLDNSEVVKALLPNLSSIGGDSLQSSVRRLLSFLHKTELAVQLNWKGKGKKRGFSSLKLKNVVLKAIRRNRFCHQATDDDIEKIVKEWLRYAADRDGGRKKREEKRKSSAVDSVNGTD